MIGDSGDAPEIKSRRRYGIRQRRETSPRRCKTTIVIVTVSVNPCRQPLEPLPAAPAPPGAVLNASCLDIQTPVP